MDNKHHTDIARKLIRRSSSRIAIKFGSACIVNPNTLHVRNEMHTNVDDISRHILNNGNEAIIISSGAVALGRNKLDFSINSKLTLAEEQACASVGQIVLSDTWTRHFNKHGKMVGQILLKHGDLDPKNGNGSYKNFINTNSTLLTNGAIPVINENDTTATEELRFGDNDEIGALVAKATDCDLMVILSKEQGFYDRDPSDSEANIYSVITSLTDEHWKCAKKATDNLSKGGMITKLKAIKIAMDANIPVILGSGRDSNSLKKIISGENDCTCFVPPSLLKELT